MSDEKTTYSIGHLRMKYLDLANITFAQGNMQICKGHLDNFLDTVDEESEAGKQIISEYKMVDARRKKLIEQLKTKMEDMDYLEKKDMENRGMTEIEVDAIHDCKEICWRIGLKMGLFYD